jgi:hypothetical protein
MLPKAIRFYDGEMYWADVLSESGVVWVFFQNCCSGRIDGAAAFLEGQVNMAGKRPSKNGHISIAEKLLLRKKEAAGNTTEAYDEDFVGLTPNVHELLTRTLVDDKKAIEPASLLIFARSGSWHACLSHKGLKLKWWGEGGTIKHALAALEVACCKEMGQETPEGSGASTGQP